MRKILVFGFLISAFLFLISAQNNQVFAVGQACCDSGYQYDAKGNDCVKLECNEFDPFTGGCKVVDRRSDKCIDGKELCDPVSQTCKADARTPCSTNAQCEEDYADNQKFDKYVYCITPLYGGTYCQFVTGGAPVAGYTPTPCGAGGIQTGLGCIPVGNTTDFIGWFLRWAIGIAGGVAFLLILYAGFQIITSGGDPEKLKAGRELLTSAIAGLILIIFSVFLLRLIGVQILQIPGL